MTLPLPSPLFQLPLLCILLTGHPRPGYTGFLPQHDPDSSCLLLLHSRLLPPHNRQFHINLTVSQMVESTPLNHKMSGGTGTKRVTIDCLTIRLFGPRRNIRQALPIYNLPTIITIWGFPTLPPWTLSKWEVQYNVIFLTVFSSTSYIFTFSIHPYRENS